MSEFAKVGRINKPARVRAAALLIFLLGIVLGVAAAPTWAGKLFSKTGVGFLAEKLNTINNWIPYRLGLDIKGGVHLVYQADVSAVRGSEAESMEALRDVIERRVNLFGISEPIVQVERTKNDWRIIVELAGVHNIKEAVRTIGITPFLEFKEELEPEATEKILAKAQNKQLIEQMFGQQAKELSAQDFCSTSNFTGILLFIQTTGEDPCFSPTELKGKHIKSARVGTDRLTGNFYVSLELTAEGKKLFETLTEKNKGKRLAIYLDGLPISMPVVQEKISGGRAQITGRFTQEEAITLARRLNAGALPVPIKLISQQLVGATLGEESLQRSFYAGVMGLLMVALFMLLWYRLPGLLAVMALFFYIAAVLSIFKLLGVTLTIAGIVGFILSIGMAVDANILIFERMKEELRESKSIEEATKQGFERAWTSIRDSNVSSLITAGILYWMGTSVIRGFALTLSIGVLVSMISAITITRTFLLAVLFPKIKKIKLLFLSGISVR